MIEYPPEWGEHLLGDIAEVINGRAYKLSEWEEEGTPVIRLQNLTQGGGSFYYSNLSLPERQYCRKGDLLYMWSASFGPHIWWGEKAIFHYHIWKIEPLPRLVDKKYLYYLLDAKTQDWKSTGSGMAMIHLTKAGFEKEILALPPLPEQKKIAEILSGIDVLLYSLAKQNQKLEAAKAALSKELLTGLSSGSKDSLYGQIPEHWHESTLGEVVGMANLQTGPFGSQLHANEYTAEGIPVVMPQDMKKYRVVTEKIARITPARAQSLKKHRIAPGDILFSRRGDIGRHALISSSESNWICGTGCLRVRANDAINPGFLSELLRHRNALEWLNANAVGQTMLNLNTSILSGLPVVVPPKTEQRKIADSLRSIDQRYDKISDEIALVQHLKTAISSDILSGRKRVTL